MRRTYEEMLAEGRQELECAGVPEAELDAWYLLEELSGMTRAEYFLRKDEEAPAEIQARYREWISRRKERIPLQHIIGKAWFMGMEFLVSEAVLIPRQDTEILAEEAGAYLQPGMRILDMCTGSGCILLSLLAGRPDVSGVGADVSGDALRIAAANEQKRIAEGIVSAGQAQWLQTDLFERVQGRFDVLVSNPPYIPAGELEHLMPEVRDHDPRLALDGGTDGLDFYRRIIAGAEKILEPGGRIFLEIGHDQGEAAAGLLRQHHYTEIRIRKDLAGLDRVAAARLP